MGTEIKSDGKVKSTNEYDTSTGGRIDVAYDKPGGTFIHEITEGHAAAKISDSIGQPSAPDGSKGSVMMMLTNQL